MHGKCTTLPATETATFSQKMVGSCTHYEICTRHSRWILRHRVNDDTCQLSSHIHWTHLSVHPPPQKCHQV